MLAVAAIPAPVGLDVAERLRPPQRFTGPLRRLIRLSRRHGLWIAAWSVVGWIGTALVPALIDKPFALMMLSPRALFAALAVDSVSLVPFVLLGTARLGVTDASYFIIGRRIPEAFVATSSPAAPTATAPSVVPSTWSLRIRQLARRGDSLCRWLCTRPLLAGSVLFFRPNGKYLAAAGAYGVSPVVAAVSSMLGTATFLAVLHLGVGSLF